MQIKVHILQGFEQVYVLLATMKISWYMFYVGHGASIPELVDFIFALQIAKKLKKEPEDITYERDEVLIFDPFNEIF